VDDKAKLKQIKEEVRVLIQRQVEMGTIRKGIFPPTNEPAIIEETQVAIVLGYIYQLLKNACED
jgi:hypothetical protein